MVKSITQPDSLGHWGAYGGRFVPETLMAPLEELTTAYEAARADESFQPELDLLLRDFAGSPHGQATYHRRDRCGPAWRGHRNCLRAIWFGVRRLYGIRRHEATGV